ncbi:torCAD operon transcriptional regulatory protein torR [Burkholderia thailandensis MSMB121]|uniref:response regulator transcription factor n=1 Tax=Burkholderia humptydooensis TaxID=430531 RepID=UPI0003280010|nr:response regulator transcription factor [Burkholderia humptydooensis]AGK47518.1 torCAD operon transcriptional regulatory protein torR [Burkholderia thailandensis MSMB121]ATF35140.1 DNA-binding response regulator [Burkholderia thailandensis]KST75710.1 two-component system response regulator [Burkholderia humptydooensis]
METAPGRILVVEDDPITRTMLARYLCSAGFDLRTSGNVAQARDALRAAPADVLLLDINLPDGDGISLARELREHSTAGIIFVTQRDGDLDRVLGLETAGDDYITKPFRLRELLARVRALLRRQRLYHEVAPVDTVLTFDRWLIDLRRRELALVGGAVLPLTPREFDLLAALVMVRGTTLTREYLLEVVSKRERTADARTVDTLIARLRRKMSGDAGGLRCPIGTVVGVGYRLDAAVNRCS